MKRPPIGGVGGRAGIHNRREVKVMVETGKRLVSHSFYSKAVKGEAGEGTQTKQPTIGLTLVIDDTTMTNDQLAKLMDILDRAAEDANAVMGW